MYAYIKGTLIEQNEDGLVLEVAGIGYNVRMMPDQLVALPPRGSELKVYTYTSVREDAIWLYGFLTHDELTMFKLLITVSGIGPKGAQGVLSVMTPNDLRFAIFIGDAKQIAKAPGVGAKSAQRIILELKDKVSIEDTLHTEDGGQIPVEASNMTGMQMEAIEALTALGYGKSEATRAVTAVILSEDMNVEAILKKALKELAFM